MERLRVIKDNYEPINKEGVTNLIIILIDKGGLKEVYFQGRPHTVESLALQGYIGEQGGVAPHVEGEGVTEMYFPLVGSTFMYLNGKISQMHGVIDPDKVGSMQMALMDNKDGVPTLMITYPESLQTQTFVYPTIIGPGIRHATAWKRVLPQDNHPLFLALKIKPVNSKAVSSAEVI